MRSAKRSSLREWLKSQQGQDIVELALVLPLVLVIVMGVVDFGRAFNTYMVIVNAAREGAREAATALSSPGSISEASLRETRRSGISDSAVTVTVAPASVGMPVRVTVKTDFPLLSGVLPIGTIPLSATVEMVHF